MKKPRLIFLTLLKQKTTFAVSCIQLGNHQLRISAESSDIERKIRTSSDIREKSA